MNDPTSTAIAVLEPEIVGKQLEEVEVQAGLATDSAIALRGQFADYYNDIVAWREKTAMITDPADPTCQKVARDVRLGLKKVRCEIENKRKALKADSLSRGKAIDGFVNVLKYLCEPIEAQLLDVETYVERQEAARIAALAEERTRHVVAAGGDPTVYNLGVMDDATFTAILSTIDAQRREREEAARKAEADRVAREQAEAAERERIRLENEALKAEAAKREKAAAVERQRVEAERKAERDAAEKERAKLEAQAKAERQAREYAERIAAESKRKEAERIAAEKAAIEAKAKAERIAAAKAARAPDRAKVDAFAKLILDLELPNLTTTEGKNVMIEISQKRDGFACWIQKQAETL